MGEPPDDERLAALRDGRVTGPDRDALLSHLATDEGGEDYEVFADASEIIRNLEDEDVRNGILSKHDVEYLRWLDGRGYGFKYSTATRVQQMEDAGYVQRDSASRKGARLTAFGRAALSRAEGTDNPSTEVPDAG